MDDIQVIAQVVDIDFDARSLFRRVVQAEQRPLSLLATRLERDARSLVKGSRRKTLSELTAAERRSFFVAKLHDPGAQLPWVRSQPGEPPFSPTGRFRESIFGVVDTTSNSVVLGSTLPGGIPARLEKSGTIGRRHIAARPLMLPTLQRDLSAIPSFFEGMV